MSQSMGNVTNVTEISIQNFPSMQKVCRVILRQGHFQQEGKHESLSCIANNSVCTNNKWEKEVFATTKR